MYKIKYLRNKNNESQTDLSKIIGVSLRTIQNYESGKVDVPLKKLNSIAQHYNVSVSYLFENESEIEKIESSKGISFIDTLNSLSVDEIITYIYKFEKERFEGNTTYEMYKENIIYRHKIELEEKKELKQKRK